MKVNASIVANFFLKKSWEEKIPITPMKLQKLVYIAHGWVLAISDKELDILDGEEVQAWQHGPVITSLYHEFKHNQNTPIKEWSRTFINATDSEFITKPIHLSDIDSEQKDFFKGVFDAVWEAYKEYGAWALSEKTHEKGTPWTLIYKDDSKNLPIPNLEIKKYYENYLRELANKDE